MEWSSRPKEVPTSRKRYAAEQIIRKLREAEVELARGLSTGAVCKRLGVTTNTCYRWRNEYGGLKVVHPQLLSEVGFFKRFLREAQVGETVRHKNVVRTYDCDATEVEGKAAHFLVMEYVECQTLRDLLDELERVPEELCRHIGREVAKSLAAIHEAGVVHRDIKPENALITEEHGVKVMDLGVARHQDEAIRRSHAPSGMALTCSRINRTRS